MEAAEFDPYSSISDEVVELMAGGPNGRSRTIQVPRSQVFKLAGSGAFDKDIADFFGISFNTLHKHFEFELNAGRIDVKMKLRSIMFQRCLGEKCDPKLLMFVAKNYLGLSDTGPTEAVQTLEADKLKWTIEHPKFVKPTTLTEDERAELESDEADDN